MKSLFLVSYKMSPNKKPPNGFGGFQGFFKKEKNYALPIILNMPVPQVGHSPFIAFLPFFMVVSLAFFMSLFVLHFTQYASMFKFLRFVLDKSKFSAYNKQVTKHNLSDFF